VPLTVARRIVGAVGLTFEITDGRFDGLASVARGGVLAWLCRGTAIRFAKPMLLEAGQIVLEQKGSC
jgi:hypothetical protein